MKPRVHISLILAIAITAIASPRAQGAIAIEPPTVLDDAMISITVSDFHGFLNNLGTTAAQISPMLNAMTLKSMIGMQLGDPMLTGIPTGKGLAVVALDPQTAFGVIELSSSRLGSYTNTLNAEGMRYRHQDGVLVVAKTPLALDKGIQMAPAVRSSLLAKRTPTLRIGLQPAAYVARNGEQIEGMVNMMTSAMETSMQMQAPNPAAPQNATELLKGETRVVISLLQQIRALEFVVIPANGALRIQKVVAPAPGTRLAALINAPAKNRWNPRARSGTEAATIKFDLLIQNRDALNTFITGELQQLAQNMDLDAATTKSITTYIQKWLSICGGTASESILTSTAPGMSMNYVTEISDEKAALAMLRTLPSDLKTTGLLDLNADMGMPMSVTFTEKVRTYQGIAIHELGTRLSTAKLPAAQRQQMDAMNLTNMKYDVAILKGLMIYTMGSTRIETIIDRVLASTATTAGLTACQVYPAGGFCYSDMDIGRYLEFVSQMIPQMPTQALPLTPIINALKGADPITSAGYISNGLVLGSMNIPASLLARIGQAVMAVQMQKMQQQMGGASTRMGF